MEPPVLMGGKLERTVLDGLQVHCMRANGKAVQIAFNSPVGVSTSA